MTSSTQRESDMAFDWKQIDDDKHVVDIDDNNRLSVTEYYFSTGSVFHVALNYHGLGSDPTLKGAKWIAETHPKVTKLVEAKKQIGKAEISL